MRKRLSCLLRERVGGVIYRGRDAWSSERRRKFVARDERKVSRARGSHVCRAACILTISWSGDNAARPAHVSLGAHNITAVRWTWRYFCPRTVDLSLASRLILFFRHRRREQRAASPNATQRRVIGHRTHWRALSLLRFTHEIPRRSSRFAKKKKQHLT